MSTRHIKTLEQVKGEMANKEGMYLAGYLAGLKDMYGFAGWENVEQWFGDDPQATTLTLKAIAIQELLDEQAQA